MIKYPNPEQKARHSPKSGLPGSREAHKREEQLYAECLRGTTQKRGPPGTLRGYKIHAAGGTMDDRRQKRHGTGRDVSIHRGQCNPSPTPAWVMDLTYDQHPAFLTWRRALSANRAPLSVDLWKSGVRRVRARRWHTGKPQRERGSYL